MTFDRTTIDLDKVNSLTKYPPIPTYHKIDPRDGSLLEEPSVTFVDDVIATEKVDGVNSRMIFLPDGTYLLGSREEVLYAQGDLIVNPVFGLVEQLRAGAEAIAAGPQEVISDCIVVTHLELYGGQVGPASKQYSSDREVFGWRLFDVAIVEDWEEKLAWSPERIAAWRNGGGQWFADEEMLTETARVNGMALTPRLLDPFYADAMPTTVEAMNDMLVDLLPETRVGLDERAGGRPEGIVFRSRDRSVIAKARFRDYERTLKRRAAGR